MASLIVMFKIFLLLWDQICPDACIRGAPSVTNWLLIWVIAFFLHFFGWVLIWVIVFLAAFWVIAYSLGPEQILYSVSSAADRRPVSWDGESWDAVAGFPDKGGERRSKRMETLFSTSPVMSFLMRFWGSRFCLCSYRSIELLWLTHEVLEQPGRQVVKWRAPLTDISAVLSVLALIVAVKHLDAMKKRILLLCRTRKYFKRYCSKHRVGHFHIWSCWCNSAVWRSSPPPAPLAKTSL